MPFESLTFFVGGTLFFLFSISKLSSVVQLVFGGRIRDYIRFAVQKKVKGLTFGILVTLLFQSSSATTVLIVSMVSAGLLSFSESLPIILGADIGTTLTAQFVVWKVTELSPVILLIGLIVFLLPEERWKEIGEAIFYFGLLLFGLLLVSKGATFLKESPVFNEAILDRGSPLLAFIFSLLFTLVVQSSAIPISMAIILAQKDLIGLHLALPIVLGANLGTTGTAMLGSLVVGPDGKKAAFAHVIFKGTGVLIVFIFFPLSIAVLNTIPVDVPQKIALSHFFFNLFISGIFYPFLSPLVLLLEKLIPAKGRSLPLLPEYLNWKSVNDPDLALLCVKKELLRQIMLSKSMVEDAVDLLYDFKTTKKRNIHYVECVVDNLQSEILKYLWEISSFAATEEQSRKLFAYTGIVHNIERIGDHAVNIGEVAETKKERKTFFSYAAVRELDDISERVKRCLENAIEVLEKPEEPLIDELRKATEETEKRVRTALSNHLERFYCKICRKEAGPLFVDVLTNIEAISRHIRLMCENLLQQYQSS